MKSSLLGRYVVGVDEVGRGPLAGPVCIGVCAMPAALQRRTLRVFRGVKDSKQLSEEKREEWFLKVVEERNRGGIDFRVSYVSHSVIDRRGIAYAVRLAIRRSLRKFEWNPRFCKILLDGGIKAPDEFENQKTIIGGDTKEPIIALASIVAKVKRDRRMKRLAKRYPGYGFEIHKGYGTKAHYRALRKNGVSDIHRRSFLKKFFSRGKK